MQIIQKFVLYKLICASADQLSVRTPNKPRGIRAWLPFAWWPSSDDDALSNAAVQRRVSERHILPSSFSLRSREFVDADQTEEEGDDERSSSQRQDEEYELTLSEAKVQEWLASRDLYNAFVSALGRTRQDSLPGEVYEQRRSISTGGGKDTDEENVMEKHSAIDPACGHEIPPMEMLLGTRRILLTNSTVKRNGDEILTLMAIFPDVTKNEFNRMLGGDLTERETTLGEMFLNTMARCTGLSRDLFYVSGLPQMLPRRLGSEPVSLQIVVSGTESEVLNAARTLRAWLTPDTS